MNQKAFQCHEQTLLNKNNGKRKGVGKRSLEFWNQLGMFQVTENELMNRIRIIRNRGFLNEVQIQTIRKSLWNGEELEKINASEYQRKHSQGEVVVEGRPADQYNVKKLE